ncbi:MAG TPA: serine hydrolase [Caulobacterales bacterium]|nr:serine hydrolase [Caulobacterales bacterium]
MNRRAFLTSAACTLATASAGAQTVAPPGRFGAAIAYSAERDGAALLIARNGLLLGEYYTPEANPSTLWPLGAATRAFTPLLAASLVRDGLMRLDEPVGMTLGDWAADPVKSLISIQALLAGVSGITFRERGGLAEAIALAPDSPPGARFSDDPAAYVLFSEIARRKLISSGNGLDPASYLTYRTLAPIGCSPVAWARTGEGVLLHDGAAASARGWAQAGELIRREGVWRAEQLVDSFSLREATRGGYAEPRAGIGVWLAAGVSDATPLGGSDLWRMRPPAPADLIMAAGGAGQRLYIVPSQHLVAVRLPRTAAARDWSDADFLPLLLRDL